jgi:hypothetical protein
MARSSRDARSTGSARKRLEARRVRRLSTFYASCNKHSKINQVWNKHSKNEMLSRRWSCRSTLASVAGHNRT